MHPREPALRPGPSWRRRPQPAGVRLSDERQQATRSRSVRSSAGSASSSSRNIDQRCSKATSELTSSSTSTRGGRPGLDRVLGQQALGEGMQRPDGGPVELLKREPAAGGLRSVSGLASANCLELPPDAVAELGRAAFSVKVMAAIERSSAAPVATSASTRSTRAVVLPEPAPASTNRVEPRSVVIRWRRPLVGGRCRQASTTASSSDPLSAASPGRRTRLSAGSPLLRSTRSSQIDHTEAVGIAIGALDQGRGARSRSGGWGRPHARSRPTICRPSAPTRSSTSGGHRYPIRREPALVGREPVLGLTGSVGRIPHGGAPPARRRAAAASCHCRRGWLRSEPLVRVRAARLVVHDVDRSVGRRCPPGRPCPGTGPAVRREVRRRRFRASAPAHPEGQLGGDGPSAVGSPGDRCRHEEPLEIGDDPAPVALPEDGPPVRPCAS